MALSLSITDLWKIFRERGKTEKDQIVEWLESVTKEAKDLASIWAQLVRDAEDGVRLGSRAHLETWEVMYRYAPHANEPHRSELGYFYGAASSVLGGRIHEGLHAQIVHRLAQVLVSRDCTQQTYIALFSKIRAATFIDSENKPADLHDLKTTFIALQKEVAALDALVKTFKAQPLSN